MVPVAHGVFYSGHDLEWKRNFMITECMNTRMANGYVHKNITQSI